MSLNGLTRIHRQTNKGAGWVEEPLDYEQTWETDKFFVFKCYDAEAHTVYLHIDKDTLLETILGEPNLINLRVPLPPEEGT